MILGQNQILKPNRVGGTTLGSCVTHPTHIIVSASTVDPNVGYDTVIRPAHGLIGYSFIEYQFRKQFLCSLVATLSHLWAVYSSKPNPDFTEREKSIAIWYSNTFGFSLHLPPLSLSLVVPPTIYILGLTKTLSSYKIKLASWGLR